MSLGINVEFGGGTVENRTRAMKRVHDLQMSACLTFGVPDADELKANGVQDVIVRHYPDGGVNTKLSEADWSKKYQDIAAAGYHIAVTNEDGVPTDWLCNPTKGILPAALKRGWKVNAPINSVGTPNPNEYKAMFLPIFELAAQYPGLLALDFHEYFFGSPINGMRNFVNNADVVKWSPDMPLPELDRKGGMRYWHAGRFVDFALQVCNDAGLPHPLMFCSELGMEAFPDSGNHVTGGTGPGWLGWWNFMKANWPQWSPARTYAKMLIWLDKNLYAPNGIRPMIYCYGAVPGRTGDQDWGPFDIEGRTGGGTVAANQLDQFWDEMAIYAAAATTLPAIEPPPPSPPIVVTPPASPPPPIVTPPVTPPALTADEAMALSALYAQQAALDNQFAAFYTSVYQRLTKG